MPIICPTITAESLDDYNGQMAQIATFVERVHIDLADGVFAPTKLISPDQIWWPAGVVADIHVMYQAVAPFLAVLIAHKPNLVIMHAESAGNFHHLAQELRKHDIKVGIALLADTPVSVIKPVLEQIDHVLIFSGDLGHFGGHAKMSLLAKSREIKHIDQSIEIGWDGGVNQENAHKLVLGGVDVLNAGGAIHNAEKPQVAYAKLKAQAR